jgi:hypothetical protein
MVSLLRSFFSPVRRPARGPARRLLEVERLEDRVVPAGIIAVGSGAGAAPQVALFHDTNNDGVPDGAPYAVFPVLSPSYHGGVRVAVGHFTSTTTFQVAVAAGPGAPPIVQVFPLASDDVPTGLSESFLALAGSFKGGLFVTRAHSNGATFDSLIVAADAGGKPSVVVYNDGSALNGATPNDQLLANSKIDSFLIFGSSFKGGVRLAAGRNLAAAGSDFVAFAPGPGAQPQVTVLQDKNNDLRLSDDLVSAEYVPVFEKTWKGGLFVALGDIGSPSTNPELIVSKDAGGKPEVAIFSDANLNGKYGDDGGPVSSFFVYGLGFKGGVRVLYSRLSAANVGQSGELMVAPGSGSLLPVKVFKTKLNTGEIQPGDPPISQFFPLGPGFTHGCFVSFAGNGI